MRTMGISPGDVVLVIEHRGEQQIVHSALVAAISMDAELAGALGETMIDVVFVSEIAGFSESLPWKTQTIPAGLDWPHGLVHARDVVHISHRDWIEGRAGLAYEELPGPTPGICRYCRCTEQRACPGGCAWLYPERTVCSNPDCAEKYVKDNLPRTTAERGPGDRL
jgi:hypothetical protein